MGPATLSCMEPCWPKTGSGSYSPATFSKFVLVPATKGHTFTEVVSVDSSMAVPTTPSRSGFQSAKSDGPSSDAAVEETRTVKWFNAEKGYGFIARDSGAEDVFVHVSALERSGLTGLGEGDRVIVGVVEGRNGPEAARVRLV
jgi:CspA family cold shock protein